jgi:hypothetical protein
MRPCAAQTNTRIQAALVNVAEDRHQRNQADMKQTDSCTCADDAIDATRVLWIKVMAAAERAGRAWHRSRTAVRCDHDDDQAQARTTGRRLTARFRSRRAWSALPHGLCTSSTTTDGRQWRATADATSIDQLKGIGVGLGRSFDCAGA